MNDICVRLIKENVITVTGMALFSTSQEQCYQELLEAEGLYPSDLLWLPLPQELTSLPLYKENPQNKKKNPQHQN